MKFNSRIGLLPLGTPASWGSDGIVRHETGEVVTDYTQLSGAELPSVVLIAVPEMPQEQSLIDVVQTA